MNFIPVIVFNQHLEYQNVISVNISENYIIFLMLRQAANGHILLTTVTES